MILTKNVVIILEQKRAKSTNGGTVVVFLLVGWCKIAPTCNGGGFCFNQDGKGVYIIYSTILFYEGHWGNATIIDCFILAL